MFDELNDDVIEMPPRSPRLKKIRRFGTPLPGLTRKEPTWKDYGPGAHGDSRARRKKSDYRLRLEEKQKVRANYGVSERQLRKYFAIAARTEGVTGENLFAQLERRLDNVVFRLAFSPTIPGARQLVVHGHIEVDGVRVDRPGFLVKPGQVISVKQKSQKMPVIVETTDRGPRIKLPDYLQLDGNDKFTGRVMGTPTLQDVPFIVDEAAIVEFYAR